MLIDELSVLVVDDVNAMRIHIKTLLKKIGFKNVLSAQSAEEAVKFIEGMEFHLILSDWHMGGQSGLDLLKMIRSHPKTKNISFIMFTADSTREQVVEAVRAGVDEYLIKPLTAEQMQNKIFSVLLKKGVM